MNQVDIEGPLDTATEWVNKVTWEPRVDACPFPPEFLNEMTRMTRKNREGQAL